MKLKSWQILLKHQTKRINTSKTVNTDKNIVDEKITEETIKATDNDSIDKKIIETKEDNRLVIIEDTKPNINKDIKPNINKDTKRNIDKDTKPNIKTLKVFIVVRYDNKDEVGWEKRKITWVFQKSHVTELCEKWISSRGNYAYT